MMELKHNIENHIIDDLKNKMVFIAGPRQVGKTTLGKKIINQYNGIYLLYDDVDDRRKILKKEYPDDSYVCLDELHKYQRWKSYLKGVYDKKRDSLHILVTGSARLDVYQKSGDSLFGRYYLYHLHPFTVAELNSKKPSMPVDILSPLKPAKGLDILFKFGGFPEPFMAQNELVHRRWSNQRRDLLIKEDMRELTEIKLISIVENLMLLLPEKIGALFSYTSLSEDLRVSVPTISSWLSVFEKLYIAYKILPYSKKVGRSIHKRPKYYLWDWSQLETDGQKFENMIASHLYKAVTLWTDLGFANCSLNYIHTKDGKEVDFLVQKDNKPWFLVEAKLSSNRLSKSLCFFSKLLKIPGIQVINDSNYFKSEGNLCIISADRWLGYLE